MDQSNVCIEKKSGRSLSVGMNFSWNFIGKFAYAASRGILLIIIAKLGSAHMVGQFALALAITAPVFMLADLNLRSVYATDTINSYDFGHYMGLRCVTALIALCVIGAIIAIFGYDLQTALVIWMIGIAKAVESISDVIFGLFQKYERMDKLGKSLMMKGVLSVASMGFFLWARNSLVAGVIGLAIAWLAVLLVYDIVNARCFERVRILIEPGPLWKLVRLSLPLGMVLLFISLNSNVASYFIDGILGAQSLGYYASIAYIVVVGDTMVNALGQSTNTRLAKSYAEGNMGRFIGNLFYMIIAIAGVCFIGLIIVAFAGSEILTLLYKPEYAAYKGVFLMIMFSASLTYLANIVNYAVTAARIFKIQPVLYGVVLAVSALFNALLIPVKGLEGAALSAIISSCLQFTGNLLILVYAVKAAQPKKCVIAEANLSNTETAQKPEFEVVYDFQHIFPSIIREWREILKETSNDILFIDPDWVIHWWNTFGDKLTLFVIIIRYDGMIAGICPFVMEKKGVYSEVRFIGSPQATYMDLIVREKYREQLIKSLVDYMNGFEGSYVFCLSGMLESSPNYIALKSYLTHGNIHCLDSHTISPFVMSGNGENFETYYKSRFSSHALKNFRRDEKRLKELGEIKYTELDIRDIDQVFSLHNSRWKKKMDTSGFSAEKSREFFEGLILNHSLSFHTVVKSLYLGRRLIAFQMGLKYNGRYLFYRSAHDDLFSIYAPGKLVKKENIRECFQDETKICDLGIGFEPYKMEWTDNAIHVKSLTFPKRNSVSMLIFAIYFLKGRLRDILKSRRGIVVFKRNSLGKVKYFLSIANIRDTFLRIKNGIRYYRPMRWLEKKVMSTLSGVYSEHTFRLFHMGIDKEYSEDGTDLTIRLANIDDIHTLAGIMDCTNESIVKRFYQQDKCFVASDQGRIIHCCWLSLSDFGGAWRGNIPTVEKDSAFIYDNFTASRYRNINVSSAVLFYILNYLYRSKIKSAYIIIGKKDSDIENAVYKAGFRLNKFIRVRCFIHRNIYKISDVPSEFTYKEAQKSMKVVTVHRIEELADYKGVWEKILDDNHNDNPFLTYDWVVRWWNFFGKEHELLVVLVFKDKEVVGICPFMITKKRVFHEVNFIGYGRASYMDLIMKSELRNEVIRAVAEFCFHLGKRFVFHLHGMREDSPNLLLLKEALIASKVRFFTKSIVSRFISTSDKDFDQYYKSRCTHDSIRIIKKIEKRLSEMGSIEWKKLSEDTIDNIFLLHEKRWLKKNDGNGFAKGRAKEFFTSLALEKSMDYLKVHVYSLNFSNRIIGFSYGLECGGKFLFYRIAHDDDFAVFAPGKIVTKLSIKDCFHNGLKVFDFSTGYERYKAEWTDETVCIHSVIFGVGGALPRFIVSMYRALEKTKQLLKKNKALVHFKNNTLGKLKYLLSKEHFSYLIKKISGRIKNDGIKAILTGIGKAALKVFYDCEEYLVLKKDSAGGCTGNGSESYITRISNLDELDNLSELMDMEADSITRRFFKGQKCLLIENENQIAGYAWVSFEDILTKGMKYRPCNDMKCICVYGMRVLQKNNDNAIIGSIAGYVAEKFSQDFYIALEKNMDQLVSAAVHSGFRPIKTVKAYRPIHRLKCKIKEVPCELNHMGPKVNV